MSHCTMLINGKILCKDSTDDLLFLDRMQCITAFSFSIMNQNKSVAFLMEKIVTPKQLFSGTKM